MNNPQNNPPAEAGKRPLPNLKNQDERERILRASAAVFRHKGFDAATVREIAAACGMQPGTLHYRYPSKSSLLVDLMSLCMERVAARVHAATVGESDPVLRVRNGMRAHINFLIGERDMVFVLLFEGRSLRGKDREQVVAQRDAYERIWVGFIADLLTTGMIREGVNLHLLRFMGYGAANWIATWHRDKGAPDQETLDGDQIADHIWETLAFGVVRDDRRDAYLKAMYSSDRHSPIL